MRRKLWFMRTAASVAAVVAAATADAAGGGNGLTVTGWLRTYGLDVQPPAPQTNLNTRIVFGLNLPTGSAAGTSSPTIVSARILGDYYFGRPASTTQGSLSGFRATSGLLLGPRPGTWAGSVGSVVSDTSSVSVERRHFGLLPPLLDATARETGRAVPYVGIGYSNVFDKGRWGVSADLGLMALRSSTSGVRLGRAYETHAADDSLRELRLAPMLQLGVSYSF